MGEEQANLGVASGGNAWREDLTLCCWLGNPLQPWKPQVRVL